MPTLHRDREEFSKYVADRNASSLTAAAYQERTLVITIEKGDFLSDECVSHKGSEYSRGRYNMRIIFDKSPFPPPDAWASPMPDYLYGSHWWDFTEFVGRAMSQEEQKKLAQRKR